MERVVRVPSRTDLNGVVVDERAVSVIEGGWNAVGEHRSSVCEGDEGRNVVLRAVVRHGEEEGEGRGCLPGNGSPIRAKNQRRGFRRIVTITAGA